MQMTIPMPVALRRLMWFTVVASIAAAVRPCDYFTWFFELFVGWLGIAMLVATHRRFAFSDFFYGVCAFHMAILALGAHYTYAEMPLFNWLRDEFHLSRNHFDRVGHYMQGLTPALLIRELLISMEGMKRHWLVALLSVAVAAGFSGLYEVLEWQWVAAFYPDSGPEWLGMQGDQWDAQGDILMATLGGLTSAFILATLHDRSMEELTISCHKV